MVYSTVVEEVIARLSLGIQEDYSSLVVTRTMGGSCCGATSGGCTLCASALL